MEARGTDAFPELLAAAAGGDPTAFDRVFSLAYEELRRLARVVRRGRAGMTLNTTALVHETYIKLRGASRSVDAQNRSHFMRIAARAMRQVIVNSAEHRLAEKRGGGEMEVTLGDDVAGVSIDATQVLALENALKRLESLDARQAQIVECRFFGGLTIPETAAALNVSVATVNREWQLARLWLAREMARS